MRWVRRSESISPCSDPYGAPIAAYDVATALPETWRDVTA
ncbi:hypothetical protein SBI_06241 [Streptomyces bingchenggensis BCW-1]|uniref:Uncharacterized protein n=1 Tax=Streptomyces bingchenggensis (strain BCW-1) TaxID=749414 RepID=D7BS43_STRBB|nr:hypothetical protein SBI_06241 [Streptomyces bingchenggensis BCW-1]